VAVAQGVELRTLASLHYKHSIAMPTKTPHSSFIFLFFEDDDDNAHNPNNDDCADQSVLKYI